MNTAVKIIGISFICIVLLGNIAKVVMKPIYENSFASQIERANRDCPIPVDLGKGAITEIKLEKGYLTYYISYDEGFCNILSTIDNDDVKEALFMSFLCLNAQGNHQGDMLIDKLVEENYGLKIIINESSLLITEYLASVSDIISLRKRFHFNPQEALYNLLSLSMKTETAKLPMVIDDGMILTNYQLERDNIIVTTIVDERLYSIDEFNAVKTLIKKSLLEDCLNNPASKSFLDMCKVSHTGLVFRYIGDKSHRKCDIIIDSDEIRQIVQTPLNVYIN